MTGRELVASALVLVEVPRALARRADPASWGPTWDAVVAGVRLLEVERALLRHAARLRPVELRAADAVHLASALAVGPALTGFLCYDLRLSEAARAHGLPVEAPA